MIIDVQGAGAKGWPGEVITPSEVKVPWSRPSFSKHFVGSPSHSDPFSQGTDTVDATITILRVDRRVRTGSEHPRAHAA